MKSIKQILLIITLLISGIYVDAQVRSDLYPDKLVLKTDSQIDVKFRFYAMRKKEVYLKNDLWKSILNVMSTAVESANRGQGVQVIYSKRSGTESLAKIEVKEIENNSDVFLIGSEGLTEIPSTRIEFHILLHKVAISFSLKDLDDLELIQDLSVESVWDQIQLKHTDASFRNIYEGEGVFKYGKANILDIKEKGGGGDSIELSSAAGLGYYRDRFVPDLSFKLGFNVPDRLGNERLQFGALYSQHYFFSEQPEGDFNLDLNGFLSGFIGFKGRTYDFTLALGALVHRDGSFYQGGTYKMSVYTQKENSKVEFTPELIFTNGFKEAFPAIRFGLTF